MQWRNTPDRFGLISRFLHWAMAIGVIFMLALGNRLTDIKPDVSSLYLFEMHKSLGLMTLFFVVVRLIWHRFSPPPRPIGPRRSWSTRAAKAGHVLIYLLLIAVPLSGWFASSASGTGVMLFDRWFIPGIAPQSALWQQRGFVVHGILTKALFGIIFVHILGAMIREINGDGTLTRMISGDR